MRALRRSRSATTPGLATLAALVLVVTLPGCGASDAAPTTTPAGVPATVALGRLPGPLSGATNPPTPPTTRPAATTSTSPPIPRIVGTIGDAVDGPRLLVIGDSVMASIAPRNDGIACDVLPALGWQVEIAAEPGRFVEFGEVVLDELLRPEPGDDWDAVAVMLGNQFDDDIDEYRAALDAFLERISPRPTILYTVSEVDDQLAAVNEVIRDEANLRPNVVLIDWAELTAAEPDVLLDDGGPRPTREGSGRLVLFTAAALGDAPVGAAASQVGSSVASSEPPVDVAVEQGQCFEPVFADDSAIVL